MDLVSGGPHSQLASASLLRSQPGQEKEVIPMGPVSPEIPWWGHQLYFLLLKFALLSVFEELSFMLRKEPKLSRKKANYT